jgi:hypothetical protein
MLFTLKDLKEREEADAMLSHDEKCAKYISEHIEADLDKALGVPAMGCSYHFDTGTKWNLHDLIVYLVQKIGPCDFYFSTYAIKEYQARLFTNMKVEGLIKQFHGLLDYRNEVHDPGAVQLLEENCTSVGFMRTHSKLSVLINENFAIVITGSANQTTNTTADTGVITCVRTIAEARKNWIIKNIQENETK